MERRGFAPSLSLLSDQLEDEEPESLLSSESDLSTFISTVSEGERARLSYIAESHTQKKAGVKP